MPNENENNANDIDDLFNVDSGTDSEPKTDDDPSVELDSFDLFSDDANAGVTDGGVAGGADADPFAGSNVESNAFDPFPGAPPLDEEFAATVPAEPEETGKKGKKAKKEKVKKEKVKKEKVKKEKVKKEKAPKAPKAPKEKGSYVASPTPVFFLIGLLVVALAVANWFAYRAMQGNASMFLIIFDALGLVALFVPMMLLSLLRKREICVFDMFLAFTAIFSVASVMFILTYQWKTYGPSPKVTYAAPSATATFESYETLDC